MRKLSHLTLAVVFTLAAGAAALAVFAPEAASAVLSQPWPLSDLVGIDGFHAEPAALLALRARLADLEKRAKDKIAEIADDTAAEDARRIEGDHQAILSEIEQVRGEIAEAEEAEAAQSAQRSQPSGPATVASVQPADPEEISRRAIANERQRVADINALCRRHQMPAEFAQRQIETGASVADTRNAVLDELAKRSAEAPSFPHVETGRGMQDEDDIRRRGMRDALAARMARAGGQGNVEIPAHARAYGEMGLAEMAAECIGYRGTLRTAKEVHDVLSRAFGHHTTSDFPGIFIDAMNTRLQARYEAAMPTYRRFSASNTTPDFRPTHVIRAGDFPALQPVGESGEIKAGTFSESKEQIKVDPFGVQFRLTRQMLINDQLGSIDQILGSTGDRVADWENSVMFALLLSNAAAGPTLLTDNTAMFHSNHGNLAGSGAAISVASIGVGRAAMMKQTTLDGIKANFTPVLLLTGPDKITEAEQLVTTITPAQQSNAVPESIRRLQPIGDANIPGNAWYLFADPQVAPNFSYGYLDGFEGPRLTSEEGFDVQGLKVKLEHDFGVAGIDYRGGYRNPGA